MTDNTTENATFLSLTESSDIGLSRVIRDFVLRLIAIIMAIGFPIGLVVNVLALVTLCRVKMHNATENIFIGLTTADTVTNISGILINGLILLSYYTPFNTNQFFIQNFKYLVRSDIILYMTSFTISTSLSVERIFAVYRPNDFRKIWTPRCGTLTVVTGCGSTLLVSVLIVTLISENALLMFRIVFTIACAAAVLLSNTFVVYGLKTRVSKIVPTTGSTYSIVVNREKRQTQLLIIVSFLFVICSSTNVAVAFVGMLDNHDYQIDSFLVFVYGYIRWFFQLIYSMLNSVIFVFYNRNYRKKFIDTLCCRS